MYRANFYKDSFKHTVYCATDNREQLETIAAQSGEEFTGEVWEATPADIEKLKASLA